jgi:hypothetical protein
MKYDVRLTDEAKQNVRATVSWYAEPTALISAGP